MPKLTIDGQAVDVPEGTSILQACEQLGVEIPRFCYHDKLSVAGSCRMCLVEVDKVPKPVASCAQPCAEGMVVRTDSPLVRHARHGVMELLLINHPLDCPICDQGGECDLQDQAVAYGSGQGRYLESKRAVPDKAFGPLIKTAMTRCIHCTRCIRFLEEIAGSPELGAFARGEHMEIDTYNGQPIRSELSGNLVDVCPVGALTSKPSAFTARSWEYRKTDSVDVLDAVGCAIRVDSRGNEVLRVLPRLHEDVNEIWINDRTRYACDGLRYGRLDTPYARQGDRLVPVSWTEALDLIAQRLPSVAPEQVGVLAGDLVDTETLFAVRTLMRTLGVPNLDCRQDGATYDVADRAHYIMNTTIAGIEHADAVLLIGTNPRHEATLVNARLNKRARRGGAFPVGIIGPAVDLGYPTIPLGTGPETLLALAEGRHPFADILRSAETPMLILGSGPLARPDGAAIHALARAVAESCDMIRPGWNGFNVLQRAASRVGGLDLGFVPEPGGLGTRGLVEAATQGTLAALYLVGADEVSFVPSRRTLIIYQGHHGDKGASLADVILPGAAYTEKSGTYVNTEGRVQKAERAVFPPGEAREDWAIVRALSDALGRPLPFDTLDALRAMMWREGPWDQGLGLCSPVPWTQASGYDARCVEGTRVHEPFTLPLPSFYQTDPISRASPTLARCVAEWEGARG